MPAGADIVNVLRMPAFIFPPTDWYLTNSITFATDINNDNDMNTSKKREDNLRNQDKRDESRKAGFEGEREAFFLLTN